MKSKEDKLLQLFFNYPKFWHFEKILKKIKISRSQLTFWLKKLENEGIIKRIKEKGKMPYYKQDFDNPSFKIRKKLYAMKKLYESGLSNHLMSLSNAKVVILFGSFSREDWYDKSDIDIFIYGKDEDFDKGKYEIKLKREIQVHTAENKEGLKHIDRLLPYIISGDFIKGSIQDLGVEVYAKV